METLVAAKLGFTISVLESEVDGIAAESGGEKRTSIHARDWKDSSAADGSQAAISGKREGLLPAKNEPWRLLWVLHGLADCAWTMSKRTRGWADSVAAAAGCHL